MAKIKLTQIKSRIGSTQIQRRNLDALGLRKINRSVVHEDSPVIMGMVEKVKHLITIETVEAEKPAKAAKPKAAKAEKTEEPTAAPAAEAAE